MAFKIGDKVHVEFDGVVVDHSAYEGTWVSIEVDGEEIVFYNHSPVTITKIGTAFSVEDGLPDYDSPEARRSRWGK